MSKAPPLESRQFLLVRMDRIGDLALSLPVDESLSEKFPQQPKPQWWITEGLGFVAKCAEPKRQVTELPRRISFSGFFTLLHKTRRERYAVAVVFHAPWWVSLLIFLAGIPVRMGVQSQWHSFLFFNRGVRQKRSRAEMNELEYNYQLVEQGLELPRGTLNRKVLRLTREPAAAAAPIIKDLSATLVNKQYVVIHPGMAGSARNWPIEKYAELANSLITQNHDVVITGTAADQEYLEPLRKLLMPSPALHWLDGKLNGVELIATLAHAKAVVAPSTGVAHLAASTGVRTVGIYSPVRVQHPRRWGPQGSKVSVLLPEVDCPGELACLGEACAKYDCMRLISAAEVLKEIQLP